MSFAFTCYGNDDTIASTSIYATTISQSYTVYNGDTLTRSGFTYSVRFTANPASGCNFTRWVYRLGSTTGTVQYNYSNPFTYSGTQDIYIRAEGEEEYVEPEPDEPTWSKATTQSLGTLSDTYNRYFYASNYTVYPHSFKFENAGEARFYCSSSDDTIAYLSTSTGFDSEYGEPTSILEEHDGGSGDFDFTYSVKANTTYILWVKCYYGDDSGYIDLYIEPPEPAAVRPSNFSWTYTKTSGGAFNLTATEWNNLTARINAFRKYKGLSNYSFTTAYKGNDFTAAMYNQARLAIQAISGYGTYIPTVTKGQAVTAYMLNVLVSELNSIP